MVVKLYRYHLSECLAGAMRKKAGTAETGSDKSDKSDGSDGVRFSIGDGNKVFHNLSRTTEGLGLLIDRGIRNSGSAEPLSAQMTAVASAARSAGFIRIIAAGRQ